MDGSADPPAQDAPDSPAVVDSGRRISPRIWLAAIALVAALSGVGYAGWVLVQQRQVHTASEQALAAAENYVLKLTNLDVEAIDRNFADVSYGSTGQFLISHADSAPKLRQLLIDHQATARGHVTESAVKSATKDKVVVVFFVNQAVRNKDNPEPVIDRSRIRITMQKDYGRWLASKVELL
jgi:Mce-associated membrane protein